VNRRVLISVLVAVLVLAGAGGVALYLVRGSDESGPQKTAADAFARAWSGGNLATLGFATSTAKDPAGSIQAITAGLTSEKTDKPTAVTAGTPVQSESGDSAAVPLHVTWTLAHDQTWEYDTTLTLIHQQDAWLPEYSSTLVNPKLTGLLATATLSTSTVPGLRGRIIGANGKVLVQDGSVIIVGIERSKATNVQQTVTKVAHLVQVDGAALLKRVNAAGANEFVQVISLRQSAYDQVKTQLKAVPGTVFQETQLPLAPSADFARPLIGTVGPATADIVKESKGRVQAGDQTGLSGLQRSYDEQLSGSPGVSVTATPAKGQNGSPSVLFKAAAKDGQDLKISLDEKVQNAADQAVATSPKLTGMVVIDTRNGNILAVANGGPNGNSYNRALLGQYPPGSTFKIVTTLALLQHTGITPSTTVNCPPSITVSGRKFTNSEDEEFGPVPFSTDFALSCNTAFIGNAQKITQKQLADAAGSLGVGQPNVTGVTAFTGQIPDTAAATEHAASMIGQGKVLANPLSAASTSAAIASGTWHAPRLVLNGKTDAPPAPVKIDAKDAKTIRTLMRGVVTGGTGTGMKNVPGGPVYGKTGTAEYGTDTPPKTHGWFTGFQGHLAFACVVEDGGFGADSAVPLLKKMLTDLAS
jgi:cell division protein FtsI/penicillin-binding protein 2